jgi:hypothetical protein
LTSRPVVPSKLRYCCPRSAVLRLGDQIEVLARDHLERRYHALLLPRALPLLFPIATSTSRTSSNPLILLVPGDGFELPTNGLQISPSSFLAYKQSLQDDQSN